ncbi:MAG: sigma-70 family RNA polymerase sigma factor [Oscillospiraceae bacterium]|jgi:RNA polymerase sigma-70 factor (ECF subfamily)|nr:sigma-70 family RNA polymerase sigma factor [Oscillospiraceae bacterium]
MEDSKIIDLYWKRAEIAIGETAKKYSRYCHAISFNILHNREDAEECVNDTYLKAWNAIPPKRPNCLAAFLGKITRNLSLDKFKKYSADKRGHGQMEIALSELDEVIPSATSVEQAIDEKELAESLDRFLGGLPKQKRMMFVQRYWYLMSIQTMAEQFSISESQAKSALFRIRNELKSHFEREGVVL